MSIDYGFYPRNYIGRYVKDIDMSGCVEGCRRSQAMIFCRLMGLPQIPYYYCYETSHINISVDETSKKYTRFYELYFSVGINILNRDKNKILVADDNLDSSKHYNRYKHWINWGLDKLNSITTKDVLDNGNIKRKDIYSIDENLTEIKQDIKMFLDFYKNHYYMYTSA